MTEAKKMTYYLLLMEETKIRFHVVNRAYCNADGFLQTWFARFAICNFGFCVRSSR
jgi:hypothetical protein